MSWGRSWSWPVWGWSKALSPRQASVGFLVIGLLFAGLGIGFGVHQSNFRSHSTTASGQVIRMEPRQSCDKNGCSTSDYPVVQFEAGGQAIVFTENSSSTSGPRVGDQVTVRYNTANPHEAQLDSFGSAWGLPLGFGGIGVLFVAIGIIGFWYYSRKL